MKPQSSSTTHTQKKTVGRPPKQSRPPLSPSLRAQITGQDNDHAAKENTVVLSIIPKLFLAKSETTLYLFLHPISN